MFKYVVQILIGNFIFWVSVFVSWYEGSSIIENSLEWHYSTPFTNRLNIEIITGKEIVPLDYFIYAAKFQPVFPILILLSIIYIAAIVILIVVKFNRHKWATIITIIISLFLGSFSITLTDATTTGGKTLFIITLTSTVFLIFLLIMNLRKKSASEQLLTTV
ncbi:DUF4306 domain-containing protein [Lysinibacillus sp. KU-BSD001]|uniref:DUF4306 domain-containing protein n=1 Tax=Lysinibacillus sp. KU-BSD001 TaxID=3141328 RepID=UPI0036E5F140